MIKQYNINDKTVDVEQINRGRDSLSFRINDQDYEVSLIKKDGSDIVLRMNGKNYQFNYRDGFCRIDGKQVFVEKQQQKRGSGSSDDLGSLKSPMPGKVLKLSVSEGEEVTKGTTLLVMEAMKMEHSLKAPCDCIVDKLYYKEGELVEGDVELVAITPKDPS